MTVLIDCKLLRKDGTSLREVVLTLTLAEARALEPQLAQRRDVAPDLRDPAQARPSPSGLHDRHTTTSRWAIGRGVAPHVALSA